MCHACTERADALESGGLSSLDEKANKPMEIDLTRRYHPVRRTYMASNPFDPQTRSKDSLSLTSPKSTIKFFFFPKNNNLFLALLKTDVLSIVKAA